MMHAMRGGTVLFILLLEFLFWGGHTIEVMVILLRSRDNRDSESLALLIGENLY